MTTERPGQALTSPAPSSNDATLLEQIEQVLRPHVRLSHDRREWPAEVYDAYDEHAIMSFTAGHEAAHTVFVRQIAQQVADLCVPGTTAHLRD